MQWGIKMLDRIKNEITNLGRKKIIDGMHVSYKWALEDVMEILNKIEADPLVLEYEYKRDFGGTNIYPVCEFGKLLARISGNLNFTKQSLHFLKEYGYKFKDATPDRLPT